VPPKLNRDLRKKRGRRVWVRVEVGRGRPAQGSAGDAIMHEVSCGKGRWKNATAVAGKNLGTAGRGQEPKKSIASS